MILIFLFSFTFIGLSTISDVSASSSVIYVNGSHGNDSWDGLSWKTAKLTIANATGTVSNGGTVNIANGNYTGCYDIILNKNMTIKGQSKSGTIINRYKRIPVFQIENSYSGDITNAIIQNLTIVNKNLTTSSAIYNNGKLTLINCAFTGNNASLGGAIHNSGTLNVINSAFTNNKASSFGGAIYNDGNLTVTGSTFTSNLATSSSGAIYNNGNLTVTRSTFTNNRAYGAHDIFNGGNLTITGSTFPCSYDKAIINIGNLTAHFNRIDAYAFDGDSNDIIVTYPIYNNNGTVNAEFNWWGNNKGPTMKGFTVNKWLVLTLKSNSSTLVYTNLKITADLMHDNYGILHTEGYLPNGILVTFTTTLGTISSPSYTVNGIAQSTLKSEFNGTANVLVKSNTQQLSKSVKIIDNTPPKVISTYPKNGALGCSRTATIYLKFSEKIKANTYWSKIYVKNLNTGKVAVISKSISGNTLYIKMSLTRYAYNWYQVYIPASAIKDYSGHNLTTGYTLKFKTGNTLYA